MGQLENAFLDRRAFIHFRFGKDKKMLSSNEDMKEVLSINDFDVSVEELERRLEMAAAAASPDYACGANACLGYSGPCALNACVGDIWPCVIN